MSVSGAIVAVEDNNYAMQTYTSILEILLSLREDPM